MKNFYKFAVFLTIISAIVITLGCLFFNYNTDPVSKDETNISFIVEPNSTYLSLTNKLKKADLIRSEFGYKLCVKLFSPKLLKAGKYQLNKAMGTIKIIDTLEAGKVTNPDVVMITFREGLNMRAIAKLIAKNTPNTEADVFSVLSDTAYLDSLISKYWFITNDVKNPKIYYSLEGYLFPDTYEFLKNSNVKDIFTIILNNTNKKLTPYKTEIEASKYTAHELLTLASIIELEAGNATDRAGVAGVFYNRLNNHESLGSDVTTYYAFKLELWARDLDQHLEIEVCNDYNTRCLNFAGLPIGPVSNPGIESIKAAIEPRMHNYIFFVADKNGKTYFMKTMAEHTAKINELKSKGLWYTYTN